MIDENTNKHRGTINLSFRKNKETNEAGANLESIARRILSWLLLKRKRNTTRMREQRIRTTRMTFYETQSSRSGFSFEIFRHTPRELLATIKPFASSRFYVHNTVYSYRKARGFPSYFSTATLAHSTYIFHVRKPAEHTLRVNVLLLACKKQK